MLLLELIKGRFVKKGSRKKFFGSFLLGTITSTGRIIPVSKVGTGFSIDFLKVLSERDIFTKTKPLNI